MKFLDFFSNKQNNKTDLEDTKLRELLSQEEFLELKAKRAEKELLDFLAKKNFKKRVSK